MAFEFVPFEHAYRGVMKILESCRHGELELGLAGSEAGQQEPVTIHDVVRDHRRADDLAQLLANFLGLAARSGRAL